MGRCVAERFGILCLEAFWGAPARTARALFKQSAEICLVAPVGSLAAQTRFKTAEILLPPQEIGRKLPAIARTLAEEFGAHSVLAGDDMAFAALAQLVEHAGNLGFSDATRAMLARSMPKAEYAKLIADDSAFIVAQAQRRCPPPHSIANPSDADAHSFVAGLGLPVVVKRNGFAAGLGVSICRTSEEFAAALARASGDARGFVLQQYIDGPIYGVTIVGAEGRSLGGFSFEKFLTTPPRIGATSVARLDMREDMIANARDIFDSYGMNGYAGFDYAIDRASGRAYFLEINPRLMPTGHLDCFGIDLTAAFLAAVRGEAIPAPQMPLRTEIALFPQEWSRDPDSPHLRNLYHDVPWDDPLVLAMQVQQIAAKRAGGVH